jgi:MoaA/NifB/PqqE/SkfB family radical SAM enzyme
MKEVILNFTEECNSRCKTCSVWKIKTPIILQPYALKNLFNSKRLEGLSNVYLTGGEPFLNDYAFDIVKLIKIYHPFCKISGATNALEPEKYMKIILKIKNIAELSVSVSLNGPMFFHDESRGISGSYANALLLMKMLKISGIKFDIAYLEIPGHEDMIEHVKYIAYLNQVNIGITKFRSGFRYNTEDLPTNKYQDFECPAMIDIIVVNPYGLVYACEENIENLIIGDLKITKLDNMQDWDYVADHVKNKTCQPCSMKCFYDKRL